MDLASLDRVEDVLMSHMYSHPICENIIRMDDFLTFEHETKLPDGSWLLIIYRYDSRSGLTVNRIFNRGSLEDVTEKYQNHPNVLGIMQLIIGEVEIPRRAQNLKSIKL
jgi:hypothetical protein